MDNELIKLIKQERPTGRMGNNNEPVWNAEKVYDLMVKAQQQVKSVGLADVVLWVSVEDELPPKKRVLIYTAFPNHKRKLC